MMMILPLKYILPKKEVVVLVFGAVIKVCLMCDLFMSSSSCSDPIFMVHMRLMSL